MSQAKSGYLLDATSVSGSDVYSAALSMPAEGASFSMQVFWTGTITAVLKLQVSNVDNPSSDADWTTTAETFPADPAGSASNTAESWSGGAYKHFRLWLDLTSGTGTITCIGKAAEA